MQLSELEQCRKLAQGFNTAAQDSNLGSCSQESEALPLSHCAQSNITTKVRYHSNHGHSILTADCVDLYDTTIAVLSSSLLLVL